jgi:adenylylsulfate reductase subunit A
MPTEPYLLGSHSGCCGLWTSGPDYDWVPDAYKIKADNGKVYNRMTTVNGLFTSGDGVGCSGHKFSSGSHAEGRMAAKQMVRYAKDHADFKPPSLKQPRKSWSTCLQTGAYLPGSHEEIHHGHRHQPQLHQTQRHDVPVMMKATHEYGAGTATFYQTTSKNLEIVMDLLAKPCAKTAKSWPPATCTN